jgi:hypothetical protein
MTDVATRLMRVTGDDCLPRVPPVRLAAVFRVVDDRALVFDVAFLRLGLAVLFEALFARVVDERCRDVADVFPRVFLPDDFDPVAMI